MDDDVGACSIHSRKDAIRVGYLTFWGGRRNAVVPVANIVPFADYLDPAKIRLLDMKVTFMSSSDHL